MSALTESTVAEFTDDRLARRNALVLAIGQALAGGNNTVIVATTGIIGAMLAPDKAMATIPVTTMVVGIWAGTLPVGILSRLYGRRFALQVGSAFGVICGLLNCVAVLRGSFALLLLGTFCGGLYASAHMSYRFAACDTASEAYKPKVISYVLAGGLFAALIGAQLVIFTQNLWTPYLFAATYLAQAGIAVIAAGVLVFLKIPRPAQNENGRSAGRPLSVIARQPRFIVAVICGAASYALMNLVMTSAPVAMIACDHTVTDSSLGIQWHVLAMYAPSFFSGLMIVRFGLERVIAAGLLLIAAAAVFGILGTSVAHFWTTLILIGIGWNFAFVGATTMVTECHRPEERNKVQSFNDFLVFGSMAFASFSSGIVLAMLGWAAVNQLILPVVFAAGAALLWVSRRSKPRPA
jgi:predicted MFS family arabinose efflux permease